MERTRRLPGPAVALALSGALIAFAGCTAEPEASPTATAPPASALPAGPAAIVAGTEITQQQLMDELYALYGAGTLRSLMLRVAVRQEAEALGVPLPTEAEISEELRRMSAGYDSEEEFYRAMKEQLGMDEEALRRDADYRLLLDKLSLLSVIVSDEEIDRYVEEHAEEFGPRVQLRLSQIVTEREGQARELMERLGQGEDFAELALAYSLDHLTAEDGGDLGWLADDDPFVDAALLAAAAEMEVGEIAGPIDTGEGYAIVLLTGRQTEPALDERTAREEARRRLAAERALPLRELEEALLDKYGAQVLDPALSR